MSMEMLSRVWKEAPYQGNKLLCLLACADWSNDDGEFYPSYGTIARKVRVTRRSAIRLLAGLVEDGVVSKILRRNKSMHSSNLFKLHPDNFKKIPEKKGDTAVTIPKQSKLRVVTQASLGSDTSVTKGSDSGVTHIHHVEPSHEPSHIHDKPKLVRVRGTERSAKSRTKKTVQVLPVENERGGVVTVPSEISELGEISPTTERVFCEECGNGMPGADNSIPDHLRGVREGWCKICDQPVPANSHTALDAVNGQLRVCSPSVEIMGITASTDPVDPPSTPVSVEISTTSRKSKTLKTDSPEEIQRKAAHKELMEYLTIRTSQPILNGAAQGAALKRILTAYTPDQAKEVLDHQLDPKTNWRGSVSWLSVQNHIADYFRRKQQQPTFGGNATDGNNLPYFTSYQTNGQRRKPGQRFLD